MSDYRTDGDPAVFSGTLGRAWTYGYYSNDRGCNLLSPGDRGKSIKELGKDLAHEIYDHFSRFGDSVDVVGHSMGGLVIRAALTGVQKRESGFPPYLYVEDVSTLSTPHRGAPLGTICNATGIGTTQCKEMATSSSFMSWLLDNPQSAQGTDWTLIGFDDDLVVPVWSAVGLSPNMAVGHKIIYPTGQFLPKLEAHMLPLWRTSGSHSILYCDHFSSLCNLADRSTFNPSTGSFDPIKMARKGNHFSNLW